MADFKLLNYAGADGAARPGLLAGDDKVIDLQDAVAARGGPAGFSAVSTMAVMENWDAAVPVLHELAESPDTSAPDVSKVKLLAPLLYPAAIFCAGANYSDHAKEMSGDGAGVDKSVTQPYFFIKSPAHTVISPGAEIRLPRVSEMVDWEAEFAVIIGRYGRNVSVADAMDMVAGYTIMNDLSARDLGKRPDWPRFGVDWFGHKNFDGAAPMGPWITPADQMPDPYKSAIKLWVNQEKMQDSHVSSLIFDIAEQIEFISRRLTLRPGDVISTGTPSGVGRPRGIFLKPGDTVRIEVEGIGTLQNPVVQGE